MRLTYPRRAKNLAELRKILPLWDEVHQQEQAKQPDAAEVLAEKFKIVAMMNLVPQTTRLKIREQPIALQNSYLEF